MKKLLTVISLLVLISFGCSEQSSVVSPQLESSRSWIELPATNNSLQKVYTFDETIKGRRGGDLSFLVNNLWNNNGYTVTGYLLVPRRAFSGTETITANVDDQYTAVDFEPSPFEFDKSLNFSVVYLGVEFDSNDDIEFGYMSSTGFVPVEYDQLIIDHRRGMLGVIGAKIDHFSRFGFTR
jgi:hypothetical protein